MASESVGFVGLGIIGSRQAAHLAKAGYELAVLNRTRERAEAWVAEHGGTVAATPREAAESSDIVITMVVAGDQGRQMILGEDGALEGARERTLFVDMSTIAPATARELAETLSAQGHAFVDAPVTGSSPKAGAGTLTIMVGGAETDVERARPLFEVMGEKIVHAGEAGQGQAVKVLSQGVTAVNCATLAQAITVGRRAGLNLDALLQVMTGGSSDPTMRELKGQGMVDHEIPVLFKLEHMLKDVVLCLEESRASGASFPHAGLAGELYSAGVGRGLGQEDFAAVLEVVEGFAGTSR